MTDRTKTIAEQVEELESRIEAIKQDLEQEQKENFDLKNQILQLQDVLKQNTKLLEENQQLRRDNYHWRRAVAFEQVAKKRLGRIRHLPIWNGLRRSRAVFQTGRGVYPNSERVYLRHWMKENRGRPSVNGGFGTLELILSNNPNSGPAGITQRDATVAATVITWLGTSCGRGFVHECERKIRSMNLVFLGKAERDLAGTRSDEIKMP